MVKEKQENDNDYVGQCSFIRSELLISLNVNIKNVTNEHFVICAEQFRTKYCSSAIL